MENNNDGRNDAKKKYKFSHQRNRKKQEVDTEVWREKTTRELDELYENFLSQLNSPKYTERNILKAMTSEEDSKQELVDNEQSQDSAKQQSEAEILGNSAQYEAVENLGEFEDNVDILETEVHQQPNKKHDYFSYNEKKSEMDILGDNMFSEEWEEFGTVFENLLSDGDSNNLEPRLKSLKDMKDQLERKFKIMKIIEHVTESEVRGYEEKLRDIEDYGKRLNFGSNFLNELRKTII